jgi:hypothetical protein
MALPYRTNGASGRAKAGGCGDGLSAQEDRTRAAISYYAQGVG